MPPIKSTGWNSERQFRDWEYQQQLDHEEAIRGVYKVRRPSGKELLTMFFGLTALILSAALIVYGIFKVVIWAVTRGVGQ